MEKRQPKLTVDIIIRVGDEVVLIERKYPPHGWAIPGGFVEYGETLEEAARREAKEETSLELEDLRQFHAYSDPSRDPRGHTVSVVFTAKGIGTPSASSDARAIGVFHSEDLPQSLVFDHRKILEAYFRNIESHSIELRILKGSILNAQVDAIVVAANSLGIMGGGVAGVIKRAAGVEVEKEARAKAPILVGEAILTSGGKTGFKGIVHAPTMDRPAMRISSESVYKATLASLRIADANRFQSLAIPGMGVGVGGIRKEEAAKLMLQAIRDFSPRVLKKVVFVDINQSMVDCWRACA